MSVRVFKVTFNHQENITVIATISSANTIVRADTDITDERAIASIRKAASAHFATEMVGHHHPDNAWLSYLINAGSENCVIEEVFRGEEE